MKRKYQTNRIFTPNNPLSPRICPELAIEIGLIESIIFLQMEFWLCIEGQEHNGHVWARKPVREIQRTFPFWGVATIDRALTKLVKKGLLVKTDKLDEGPGKGAGWFRFNMDVVATLKSVRVCSGMEHTPAVDRSRAEHETPQIGTSVLIEGKEDQEKGQKKEGAKPPSASTSKPKKEIPYPPKNEWPFYVTLYFDVTGFAPLRQLWPLLEQRIGAEPDRARLTDCYLSWIARGWQPRAMTWLDWYRDGIIPKQGNGRVPASSQQPSAPRKAQLRQPLNWKESGIEWGDPMYLWPAETEAEARRLGRLPSL